MRTLHIVPTTDAADELLARLAGDDAAGLVVGLQATTLRRVEETLATSALRGRRRLPTGARSLVLNRVLATIDPGPYATVVTKRGFRRVVDRFLDEVAAGGATFEHLRDAARRLPKGLAGRIETLARIGRAYLDELTARSLVDPVFALADACTRIRKGETLPAPLDAFEAIAVSGIVDWPPGRLNTLETLAIALERTGGRLQVTLPTADRPELAETLEPAHRAIESLGSNITLERHPLSIDAPSRTTFHAADALGETREVAARIARLVTNGVPPGQIAVVARGMEQTAPLLLDELAAQGVPVRDRRGTTLGESRVVRLALALSQLGPSEETTRERVASIAGSGLVDLRGLSDDAPMPEVLAATLRAAGVRGRISDGDGRDGFTSRLERLERAATRNGDQRLARTAVRTRHAVTALLRRIDRWPRTAPVLRHAKEMVTLVEALHVPARLRSGTAIQHAESAAREQIAWSRFARLASEVAEAAIAVGESGDISRTTFLAWLGERVSAERLRPPGARGAGVELLELQDLAGRDVPHVFVVGAYDGRLPGPRDDETLFDDEERWALNKALRRAVFRVAPSADASSPLPSRQLLQAADAALAMAAATESLTLSWPRADGRGRPLAPSPLIALGRPDGAPARVPFQPADPRLAERRSTEINARRAAIRDRAASFAVSGPSAWNGTVADPLVTRVAPGSKEKPISANALETYVACAFRSFGERILKVRDAGDLTQEATTLEVGRLGHAAAEAAVQAIVDAGLWRPDRLDDAIATGLAAASGVLDREEPDTVLGHPQLWAVTRRKTLDRLARLLAEDIPTTFHAGLRPVALELSFGLGEDGLPPLELEGVHFSGRIDRIDAGPAGALVLDYKSGSAASNTRKLSEDALLETEFQLALYVAAVHHLHEAGASGAIDAAYVTLRGGTRTKTVREAADGITVADLEQELVTVARDAVEGMRAGRFPPAPKTCDFCSLRPVCRIARPEGRP